uniref:Uncharacterized protein n=1 Tax=Timema bartmani TaxID=61472 RepID=A0A7R9I3H7_9NEOP|nr:unnamed protein product [Timema bartmani]
MECRASLVVVMMLLCMNGLMSVPVPDSVLDDTNKLVGKIPVVGSIIQEFPLVGDFFKSSEGESFLVEIKNILRDIPVMGGLLQNLPIVDMFVSSGSTNGIPFITRFIKLPRLPKEVRIPQVKYR